MMLTSAVLLTFTVLIVHEATAGLNTPRARKAMEKCMEGTSITKEIIDGVFYGDVNQPEANQDVKCVIRCFMMEVNDMAPDGKITVPIHLANDKECGERSEEDLCERAYQFAICVRGRMDKNKMSH